MKKTILIFLLLVFAASPCLAGSVQDKLKGVVKAKGAAADPCASYLVCENMNGTGTPTGWTDVQPANSVVNWDYTTTALEGTQSLLLDYNAYGLTVGTYYDFTAQNNAYAYGLYRYNYLIGQQEIQLQDSSGNKLCQALLLVSGKLRADCNVSADTVSTMSTNTLYHVWVEYEKGTGANGVCRVAFSTDGTKPANGDNYAAATTCNGTAQASRFYLGGTGSENTLIKIIDKVRVKSTAIGSSPE